MEEDRHSIDITSGAVMLNIANPVLALPLLLWCYLCCLCNLSSTEIWNDELQSRKNKKKDPFSPDKKKKPVAVSDILYRTLLNNPKMLICLNSSMFLNTDTPIYCLYAARFGYTGGLDHYQKGWCYFSSVQRINGFVI